MTRIILKADDFWVHGAFDNWGWKKVFSLAAEGVKFSVGIVGKSVEPITLEEVKLAKKAPNIEYYNHSYWHVVEPSVREFFKTNEQYQRDSVQLTNDIVRMRLGKNMDTIGFPTNACDDTTLKVLAENQEIRNIYYLPKSYNQAQVEAIGKRVIEIDESMTSFEEYALPEKSLYVIQLHPDQWSEEDTRLFEVMIRRYIERGYTFIFPSEL